MNIDVAQTLARTANTQYKNLQKKAFDFSKDAEKMSPGDLFKEGASLVQTKNVISEITAMQRFLTITMHEQYKQFIDAMDDSHAQRYTV